MLRGCAAWEHSNKNPMKLFTRTFITTGCLAALFLGSALCTHAKEEASAVKGSIRPTEEVKQSGLPALAKLTLQQALEAALVAAPGNPIKAELEVEDGNLVYSVEVVGADKSITELEIDAGNGKVLATEKESDKEEDHKAKGEKEEKSEKKGHGKNKEHKHEDKD